MTYTTHKPSYKKAKYVFAVVVAIVVMIINPFDVMGHVRHAIATVFVPLNHIGRSIGMLATRAVDVVTHIGTMSADNQRLLEENANLKAQIAGCTDTKKENATLREQMQLSVRDTFQTVSAQVVVRDTLGGNQWMMIDRGRDAGIGEHMAVVTGDSVFVGYIDHVDATTARVRLLTHPESVVNIVDAESGAEAIARGQHGLSVVVEDMQKGDAVRNGDTFVTSNIGTKFPRGLGVGTVQNVTLSEDHLFQSAHIMPFAPLETVRFVSVIIK